MFSRSLKNEFMNGRQALWVNFGNGGEKEMREGVREGGNDGRRQGGSERRREEGSE